MSCNSCFLQDKGIFQQYLISLGALFLQLVTFHKRHFSTYCNSFPASLNFLPNTVTHFPQVTPSCNNSFIERHAFLAAAITCFLLDTHFLHVTLGCSDSLIARHTILHALIFRKSLLPAINEVTEGCRLPLLG